MYSCQAQKQYENKECKQLGKIFGVSRKDILFGIKGKVRWIKGGEFDKNL